MFKLYGKEIGGCMSKMSKMTDEEIKEYMQCNHGFLCKDCIDVVSCCTIIAMEVMVDTLNKISEKLK
jgi:hypothetical protein